MSSLSTDKKPLVDYGVQIRFIKDLHDTGGGYPDRARGGNNATPPSNKYGVAVRVQGISGQPYVVLKDGEKGDSYGVQLKSQSHPTTPTSTLSSPSDPLPNGRRATELPNPYATTGNAPTSSPPDDEEVFGSPFKRPPGDGQAGSQGEAEVRAGREGQVGRLKAGPSSKTVTVAANGVDKKDQSQAGEKQFNEAGLKPVGLNGAGSRNRKPNGTSYSSSLGRHSGKKVLDSSFPEPPPPISIQEEPAPAIDTDSLAPINKLISKFNNGTPGGSPQTRGRSGARQRLRFDERRRSRSLDARKEERPPISPPSPTPPAINPYAAPLSSFSTTSTSSASSNSLGKGTAVVTKTTTPTAPKPAFKSPGLFVAKDTHPAIPKKPDMPAPLLYRGQSAEGVTGEEAQAKQTIYNILREGTSDSDASVKRKVDLIYAMTNTVKKAGSDDDGPKRAGGTKPSDLQEQLDHTKAELQEAQDELAELRMAREGAESRVRQQEDQLAELQEELRRMAESTPHSDSLQTDVRALQAELAEAAMLRQRQEESLRQRERELTALKGALKEEVESHDRDTEMLREQYGQDMEELRRAMETVSQSQEEIEEERQRVNASILSLEDELETCREQGAQWKSQLDTTSRQLDTTKQELSKARLDKEVFEGELNNLQDTLAAMKKQTPKLDDDHSVTEDIRRCHDDLKQARTELDEQKVELEKRSAELRALREASRQKEAELLSEIDGLKAQSKQDKEELKKALQKAKEPSDGSSAKPPAEEVLNQDLQEANSRLRERLSRMTKLHSSVPLNSGMEEALEDENRSLKSQLEEARRSVSRLGKERDELNRRLEERDLEREALRRGKSELEEQKRLLDRSLEKINKEMEMMMGDSRHSVASLQAQLDDYRERSKKDLLEAQRSSKDRMAELQRVQGNLKVQQEEVSRLKKELLTCGEERDSAQLERDLLSSRLKHLEEELETERSSQGERHREIRGLEDQIKTLEIELDEEKSSVELLNERVSRSREQSDQLRSDLMQERSARHDLEMDKSALERQVKELRGRVADMEGQSRPPAGLALLEGKVQELEERLHSEEREKTSIQASQRRTERKLKEVTATLDQERSQHAEQRDQLLLRVKALKRQVDESEGEVERLEGVRRKVFRDLEEQQEMQDVLHAKVTTLEAELKRRTQQARRPTLGSSNLSSEDEEGLYESNNITSILTESHLQSTNC